jgi:uncharacterized protein YukE
MGDQYNVDTPALRAMAADFRSAAGTLASLPRIPDVGNLGTQRGVPLDALIMQAITDVARVHGAIASAADDAGTKLGSTADSYDQTDQVVKSSVDQIYPASTGTSSPPASQPAPSGRRAQ